MTSLRRVFSARFALGGALLVGAGVSACQHDSSASFDDTKLISPDTGGSSTTGGSTAEAGKSSQGAVSAGGSKASAGGNAAGKANGGGGTGGTPASNGGKAGMDAGGAVGEAGKAGAGAGAGGAAGVGGIPGTAGMGGAKNDPVTVEITDIADTDVESCVPFPNHGAAVSINVDGNNDKGCVVQALINAPLTQIPDGALVSEATLTLTCIDVGDPATVYFVNEQWAEDSVRWNNKPNVGMMLGTVMCTTLGKVTIDLKSAVQAWLVGDHQPYGIYLRMETTNGIDFRTTEAEKAADRPKLTITYTLPVK